MVIIKRPDKLRIFLDLKDLNKAIKRPDYIQYIPTIDDILPQLSKARVFSVLDVKDGFCEVNLDEPSSYLTTFWTPFGRYRGGSACRLEYLPPRKLFSEGGTRSRKDCRVST